MVAASKSLLGRMLASTGLQNWSIYHRVALVFLLSLGIFAIYQAWYAQVNGTYTIERSSVINADAVDVWSFIILPENRVRWQAQIVDITRLKGDPTLAKSTRFIFWRNLNRRRWSALEETLQVVPGLYYATNQQSDKDERSLEISLEPLGTCQTKVTLKERIRPKLYRDRLVTPLTRARDDKRFADSFEALARWLKPKSGCAKAG